MQMVTHPHHPLQRFFPHNLDLSIFHSSKTEEQTQQLHAFSLKTGIFNHPSISSRLLSLYTDPTINNLPYARSVFDRIEDPSLLLWNMMIKCYVENHRSQDSIRLFSELLQDFTPDSFTLPCVIKGCARLNATEEGKQVHGLVLKIGFGVDKFVQSSLVSFYSKCSLIELARKVFETMDDKDLVSWNSLIDGYAKSGEVEIALKLFDEMPEKDLFSWTVLVDGFSKAGRVEIARKIFEEMPKKNLVSWNAMINGYMKSGNCDSALQLFDKMVTIDLITWNSMIAGYELNGRFEEALKMFKVMLEQNFKPNHATLASVLAAVSGLGSLSMGRWVHSFLVKNRIELDGVLATLLIEMYSKCGSIESALAVFQAIGLKKLGHWTSIIIGLGMHGMAEHAIQLFNEMRRVVRVGMEPNAITFVGVLNACSHAGLVNDGRRYFKMMTDKYGIEPTIEHYGCLVDVLCRAGHLEEARKVVEKMSMKPNKAIWMSLLNGAKIYANTKVGEYAAHHLLDIAPESVVIHSS